ncbi:electron transfer flavoprotein subunit alpha/FixB family protein [Nitrincola tibetensis]|uniref:Electron transfer flavoprotein subunit alpha/FixB family protein n=1 Tax=Nitrincola tibetensis TaxID=2219697 RepID=A0A364NNA0_9GAMM|nr:electron transfer flavoprotein subunit alpha/FixB family protein [Nitrincola tibetensis]RAU18514.1 electron transfer flavoprotein subunit alpha/FixB family protein [Nitrincola tibetensis]
MNDIKRRDPRSEWILRNRLHPEHSTYALTHATGIMSEWIGPTGVKRKNPHLVGFIGPSGLRRIDRSGLQSSQQTSVKVQVDIDSRRFIQINAPSDYIVVVPELPGGRFSAQDKDLFGLAQQLASKHSETTAVLGVILSPLKDTALGEIGMDRVYFADASEFSDYDPEAHLQQLTAIEREFNPLYWLFPEQTSISADLGRRLSVKLKVRATSNVWQLDLDTLIATCRASGGTSDLYRPVSRVILALAECAEPVSDTRHEAKPIDQAINAVDVIKRIRNLGAVSVDPAKVALSEAEFILSGGKGIANWDAFHELARRLGATEGASRVAVDDGHMPRDRQVGATGTWVTARVYLAIGISGAIQHLQGIQACDKVIAINTDPGCDMIKRADLAVIVDSSELIQSMLDQLQQRQEEVQNVA